MGWGWLSNPWFIGIVGSIPGGFLVNWLTGLLLGRRENREYLQKINGANREIVYAIRPGISEGQIPNPDVLSSLINATARRFGVTSRDLYTPVQISEELVKEVMDSSFISSAQKAEYCERLTELGGKSKQLEPAEQQVKEVERKTAAEYRQRVVSAVSMTLGVVTTAMIASITFLDTVRSKRPSLVTPGNEEGHVDTLMPFVVASMSMAISLLAIMVYRDIKKRRRELDEAADPAKSATRFVNWTKLRVERNKPPEGREKLSQDD